MFDQLTFLADGDLGSVVPLSAHFRRDLLPHEVAVLACEDLLALGVAAAADSASSSINLAIDDVCGHARLVGANRQSLSRGALLVVGARLARSLVDNIHTVRAVGDHGWRGLQQHGFAKKACEKSDSQEIASRSLFSSSIKFVGDRLVVSSH